MLFVCWASEGIIRIKRIETKFEQGSMSQQQIQDEILRRMSPEQRLAAATNLYYSARKLKAAWIRHLHPDWSDEQVEKEVREIFINART